MINRKCILIIGPHRSGTSALSGALQASGVFFGDDLLKPSFDNPKGFFENARIVALNDKILEQLGGNWYTTISFPYNWWLSDKFDLFKENASEIIKSQYGNQPLFAIKDPRISLLLPFWKSVLMDQMGIDIHVILVCREPRETVESLMTRNNFSQKKSTLLTLLHLLYAEYHSREDERHIVSYESLFAEPENVIKSLGSSLGIETTNSTKFSTFIDKKLKHNSSFSLDTNDKSVVFLNRVCDLIIQNKGLKNLNSIVTSELDKIRDELQKVNFEDMLSSTKTYLKYPFLYLFTEGLKAFIQKPTQLIKKMNRENIRILIAALKEENPSTIINNLKKLLNNN